MSLPYVIVNNKYIELSNRIMCELIMVSIKQKMKVIIQKYNLKYNVLAI